VTFQASGQNFTTSPASAPVTIAPRSSVSVPLSVALPHAPGDAPESVQFTTSNGLESSVPFDFFVHATDTTPTTSNQSGNASLITPDAQPGLWEIDVMQGATTSGMGFSQTVTGAVAYNQLGTFTENGLPTSTSTTIAAGTQVPVSVTVTNTTNHAGFFELQSSASDISGGAAATPVELAAGATGQLTTTLSPTAASGTAVNGTLSVIDSTDFGGMEPAIGFPDSFSDFHDFAYAYTAG